MSRLRASPMSFFSDTVVLSPWRKSQPTHSRRAYPSEMGQFQEFRTAQTASKDFCHGLINLDRRIQPFDRHLTK
jgi:hypothetical protein